VANGADIVGVGVRTAAGAEAGGVEGHVAGVGLGGGAPAVGLRRAAVGVGGVAGLAAGGS